MRRVGSKWKFNEIWAEKESAEGVAFEYIVRRKAEIGIGNETFASIRFQSGAVAQNGVNGTREQDLISVLLDRIARRHGGEEHCPEFEMAAARLEEVSILLDQAAERRRISNANGSH